MFSYIVVCIYVCAYKEGERERGRRRNSISAWYIFLSSENLQNTLLEQLWCLKIRSIWNKFHRFSMESGWSKNANRSQTTFHDLQPGFKGFAEGLGNEWKVTWWGVGRVGSECLVTEFTSCISLAWHNYSMSFYTHKIWLIILSIPLGDVRIEWINTYKVL